MRKPIEIGDYVFATKFHDGDSCDPHAVGFVSEIVKDRYVLIDNRGKGIYHNGFRRVKRISGEKGRLMISLFSIVSNHHSSLSMWSWLRQSNKDIENFINNWKE